MDPQQPPSPEQDPPPFRTTSIDDLVGAQSASGDDPDVVQGEPPLADPPAEESSADAWKPTADPMVRARARRRVGAPMLFGLGLGMILWGGMLTVDAIAPTFERDGRITEVDTARDRRGNPSYSIRGVDDHGGTFSSDVSKSDYDDASTGSVVVSRSYITGRVVAIEGSGLDTGGFGVMNYAFLVVALLGVGLMVWIVRVMRADARERGSDRPNALPKAVRWWSATVVAAFAIWVVWERTSANVGAAKESTTVATAPAPETSAATCEVEVDIDLLEGLMNDGTVTAQEVGLLITSAGLFQTGCDGEEVVSAACSAITSAIADRPDVVLQAGTRCR